LANNGAKHLKGVGGDEGLHNLPGDDAPFAGFGDNAQFARLDRLNADDFHLVGFACAG